jgi:TRAP-type mannitol/chloroaromatic compound transport system permease small subunit
MLTGQDKPPRLTGAEKTGRGTTGRGFSLQSLLKLSRGIDAFTKWVGKRLAWLILVAVVVATINAIIRKTFDVSSNSWLELQWLLFSIVFLFCAPWTLLDNEHIRIDIISNMMKKKTRDWIDVVGHLFFLIPLCIVMIITGGPFFMRSVEVNEQSSNAGGLPQWPAKSLIILGFVLLLVQGISELIKRIAVMRGLIPDPHATQVHALEAEVEHLIEAIEKR